MRNRMAIMEIAAMIAASFSSNISSPRPAKKLIETTGEELKQAGYKLNKKKIKRTKRGLRCEV